MKKNRKNKILKRILHQPLIALSVLLNRGWRKTSSIRWYEKDHSYYELPTPGEYDVIKNGKIVYRHYYGGSISDDRLIKNEVTHFRKPKKHKLPRFLKTTL